MYNEEVQEEAVELMKNAGLGVARLLEVRDGVLANAVVGTQEDGDFWYGDLDLAEDTAKLRKVAVALNKSLVVSTESTGLIIPAN